MKPNVGVCKGWGGEAGGAVNIPHKLFAAPFVSLSLSLFSAKKVPRHVRAVTKSLPSHAGIEYLKIVSVFASHVVKGTVQRNGYGSRFTR
jgi:hypothetical protein